jgi:MFS family permease
LTATLCANVFINGAAFLIPTLHTERGLDLAKAGLLSSMPGFGMVVTLIAWGYVVDRIGERIVLALGSALTAAAAFAAASVHSLVAVGTFLLLGGMAAASSNSASGRLVVGWFPPHQRGLVMGIRQTAQPLGVGLGALVIPRLAESHGVSVALLFPAVVCAVSAVVCAVAEGSAAAAARRGHRAGSRQSVSRLGGTVAHPRRVGPSGCTPGGGVDLHAGVVDDRARLVGGSGGRAGDGGAGARGRRTDRGGPVV